MLADGKQSIECDFEDSYMCSYRMESDSTLVWSRKRGNQSLHATGPIHDSKGSSLGETL